MLDLRVSNLKNHSILYSAIHGAPMPRQTPSNTANGKE
jgi:hypothetical protein